MNTMTARGLTLAVVVAAWIVISELARVNLSPWAPIVALGCFLGSGGGVPGLQKTVAGTVSGVVWVLLAHTVAGALGRQTVVEPLVLGAAVFLMVLQQRVPLLAYTTGAITGAGVALGLRTVDLQGGIRVAIALALGAVLGYVAEGLAGMIKTRRSA